MWSPGWRDQAVAGTRGQERGMMGRRRRGRNARDNDNQSEIANTKKYWLSECDSGWAGPGLSPSHVSHVACVTLTTYKDSLGIFRHHEEGVKSSKQHFMTITMFIRNLK